MRILAWGLTDVGQKRDHNEDSFLISSELGLYAVADGMGGHAGGDRASRLAVEILEREFKSLDPSATIPIGSNAEALPARQLRNATCAAGRMIFDIAAADSELKGMGTTLTALYFDSGRVYVAHVGDSRAYLFRGDRMEQLSEDHSWIEEQVRQGFMTPEEAQDSSLKHIITRSVGFEREVEVDLLVMPVLMGDCFVLCSDGLSNYLKTEELQELLGRAYYSEAPRELVDLANSRGGDDNISVVLVYAANDAA